MHRFRHDNSHNVNVDIAIRLNVQMQQTQQMMTRRVISVAVHDLLM